MSHEMAAGATPFSSYDWILLDLRKKWHLRSTYRTQLTLNVVLCHICHANGPHSR